MRKKIRREKKQLSCFPQKMKNEQIIKLSRQVGLLKTIKRQGWVLKGVKDAESVADHVFGVAFLLMLLAKHRSINFERAIKMVLIHDIGESLVGDTVYESGNKVIASLEKKHADERKAMLTIFTGYADKEEYLNLWEEWLQRKTPETQLVKWVEKLEMAMQALKYENEGYEHSLFDEFWENAEKYLKDSYLEGLFKTLKKERGKLPAFKH